MATISEQRGGLLRGRIMLVLAVLLAIPPLLLFITTPMDAQHQMVLGFAGAILAIVAHRLSNPGSRRASLGLILLSMVVSTRYLYWRITETLVFQTGFEYVLGYGLFIAELYAWTIMFFGYIGLLEARGIQYVIDKTKNDLLTAVTGSWKVWPLAHTINFRFIYGITN